MKGQPYYLAYESRYKTVFEAGVECWGHSIDDQELYITLKDWVTDNKLTGKKVIDFHMLVTDEDRRSYLKNAFLSLKDNSPMLFYKESYRNDNKEKVIKCKVNSYEEWLKITGDDYETPSDRRVMGRDRDIEVMIPYVPSRANDKDGYITEMKLAGFTVEKFMEMDISSSIQYSASIYARKL